MTRTRIIIAGITLLALSAIQAVADPTLDHIASVSAQMQTFQANVTVEQRSGRRTSTVELGFEFKRHPQKMRIEYYAPRNMKGSIIAIDGSYFYNYLPSMNRTQKQPLDSSSGDNPGEDMGALFDFVAGTFDEMIADATVSSMGHQTVDLGTGRSSSTVQAEHYRFAGDGTRQEVWFDDDTGAPVKIEVYEGNDLIRTIAVTDVVINGPIDDARFSL